MTDEGQEFPYTLQKLQTAKVPLILVNILVESVS